MAWTFINLVGHLVQVIRVYKNAEEAEVQFTVSSWSLKFCIIFRFTALRK